MSTTAFAPARWEPQLQRAFLPRDWPLVLICVGMPLTFLLGVHSLVWVVPVFVFGVQLILQREPVVIPRSALPLLMLVLWIPVPMLQLHSSALPLAIFRWLVFASPLVTCIWLMNQSERVVSTARVVRLLSLLWVTIIGFGFMAILFPHISMPSPFQRVLPGGLLANVYLRDLTQFQFAQVQELVSTSVGRPTAPMAYSNGWGSTVGLLTPFFVLDYFILGTPRRRRWGIGIALAAMVPIILSLNRGLWLSLGVAFAYVAIRRALQGSVKVALALAGFIMLVFVALGATALGDIIQQRFEIASESNNARSSLYDAAFSVTKQRPITGWGAPLNLPGLWRDVGTHGLVWFVMVCYGFPGIALLVAWMVGILVSSARAPNSTALWAHIAIVVFVVQCPIYGLLPQIMIAGVAAAVALRAQQLGPTGSPIALEMAHDP